MNLVTHRLNGIILIIFFGIIALYLSGCAISGVGNPSSTNRVVERHKEVEVANQGSQPVHAEQCCTPQPIHTNIGITRYARPRRYYDVY